MNAFEDNTARRPATEDDHALDEAAGRWLARGDRGLTESERKDLAAWLASDSRHGARLEELQRAFAALDRTRVLRPGGEREPDPDLLLTDRRETGQRRRGRFFRFPGVGAILTAAAAIAMGIFIARAPISMAPEVAPGGGSVVRHEPERMTLADGSTIELKRGAHVEVAFTLTERHVRLKAGEAHFTVAKDAARPFVVEAGGVAVRAVGTAFRVSREASMVGVLVTEGRVSVDDLANGKSLLTPSATTAVSTEPALLHAGHGVSIAVGETGFSAASVTPVAQEEMERALGWRGVWLEFNERTLAGVVEEFNRHNARQLEVRDEATARVLVTGSFRADGVDAFVRLLESSFGVTIADTNDRRVLLRKSP